MAARTRRNRIILASVLALVTGLTAVQVLIQQLRFPSPIASNILIFALVNVNIVLLLLLVLLVFRSLFKVYLERRENILGSKFRVKLAVAFVSLALLPAALLFLVASNLITTSVDSWFNIQVEESLDKALDVGRAYSRATQDSTLGQARQLAGRLGEALVSDGGLGTLRRVGGEKVREYGLDGVQIFSRQRVELAQWRGQKMPEEAMLTPAARLVRQALDGEAFTAVQNTPQGDLIRAVAPVSRPGHPKDVLAAVVVTTLVPEALITKAREIDTGIKEYQQLRMLKNPIKGIYLMLFLMVTLVIIFAAIWVGVYLARGITVPIQQLAEGTRKVAAGDLSYKVLVKADDEIGILVDSFNRMTEDLSRNKVELTQAYQEVQRSNVELDRRRDYMETVLETIAAGVLSLDAD
ncbi:MAG TPA: HAMP domain-containing protein, partial [Candidatus Acidoferrum sp.]|nr:HAMP domain-containing protein [Candidatus Acidoferrum sp.]